MGEVATINQGSVVDRDAPAPAANNALVPQNIDQAMRLADMMARSALVPKHLQGSPADCFMVIEQSARWKMSPFAVGQCTSSIHGKLMFEGKLVAAAVHNSGLLSRRLNFEFQGDGDARAVVVTGTIRGESQPRTVTVRLSEVKTENGTWQKQPDQQLCYAGARVWARRHAPEVMLGVYTPDERFDEPPPEQTHYSTRDSEPEPYPDDAFEQNLPKWRELVESGRKTPEEIIAKAETKGPLTDEQKRQIRGESTTDGDEE